MKRCACGTICQSGQCRTCKSKTRAAWLAPTLRETRAQRQRLANLARGREVRAANIAAKRAAEELADWLAQDVA